MSGSHPSMADANKKRRASPPTLLAGEDDKDEEDEWMPREVSVESETINTLFS